MDPLQSWLPHCCPAVPRAYRGSCGAARCRTSDRHAAEQHTPVGNRVSSGGLAASCHCATNNRPGVLLLSVEHSHTRAWRAAGLQPITLQQACLDIGIRSPTRPQPLAGRGLRVSCVKRIATLQVPAHLVGTKERFEISELQDSPHAALSATEVDEAIAAYREQRVWCAGGGSRQHEQLHGLTARQICWLCDQYDQYAPLLVECLLSFASISQMTV